MCGASGGGRTRSKRSSAWKQRRRKTEWKVRWLELRLKELSHQAAQYEAQLSGLRSKASESAAADAPSPAVGTPGSNQLAEAEAADVPECSPATAVAASQPPSTDASPMGLHERAQEEGASEAAATTARYRRRHERLQAEELAPQNILKHPFFAALAGVRTSSKVYYALQH